MSVGENIVKRRKELNMSQVTLAEKASVTQATICQIERGTKNPSIQLGFVIADILKCDISDLVK